MFHTLKTIAAACCCCDKVSDLLSSHLIYVYSFFLKITSGSASAVKEPGHFEVRKSSSQVSQVTRKHFFLKKVDDLYS